VAEDPTITRRDGLLLGAGWLLAGGAAAQAGQSPTSTASQTASPTDLPSDAAAAFRELRAGATVLLLRHAQTEAGVGDPPGWRLGDCASQRNLSAAGRLQAAAIGALFRQQRLRPRAVRSSPWCRCIDTARLAFGSAEPWSALASFFDDRSSEPAQTSSLLEALARAPATGFEVWVTHMVNIVALSSESVAMGEALVVSRDGGRIHNRARLKPPPGPT
jgi:phosphohistidine phosphatase SixA